MKYVILVAMLPKTNVPKWIRTIAHIIPFLALPSALWRIAMALTLPVGFSAEVLRRDYGIPGIGTIIIITISIIQELLALSALLLVRTEHNMVPRFLPIIGGKRLPPSMVVLIAGTAAIALTVLAFSQLLLWGSVHHGEPYGTARTVLGLCYLPLIFWGPFLGIVTVWYYRAHVKMADNQSTKIR